MALNINDGTNPPDEWNGRPQPRPKADRLHAFSREDLEEKYRLQKEHNEQLRRELQQATALLQNYREAQEAAAGKLAAYEAGRDDSDLIEGAVRTPGQLWHKLLNVTEDTRMAMLRVLCENARTAYDCYAQDHKGRIDELTYELEDTQTKLGTALGFDTPQSLHSLTVAVQALRNVMVDGIAARGEMLTMAEEVELPEWRQPEGLEAEKAKVRDSLKEAGIDTSAACGYEWPLSEGDRAHSLTGAHHCAQVNPLHSQDHLCCLVGCEATLSHVDAEKLAEAGQ